MVKTTKSGIFYKKPTFLKTFCFTIILLNRDESSDERVMITVILIVVGWLIALYFAKMNRDTNGELGTIALIGQIVGISLFVWGVVRAFF